MAWTKLKDIFATKKEINEVRDSLSQVKISKVDASIQFVITAPSGNTVKFLMDGEGVKRFVDGVFTGAVRWQ